MSITISIGYKAGKALDLPYREIVEDTALITLDYESYPYETEINVILTDSDATQEVGRGCRRINASTDVLSFPMADCGSPSDFDYVEEAVEGYFNSETGESMLGDIVISVDKVEEQAEKYGHSRTGELTFLTAHSTLCLFGYDHMGDDGWLVMGEKQKEILETRGYTR